MESIYWIVGGAAVSWLYLVVWFFAVGNYLGMRDSRQIYVIPNFIRWSLIVGLLPGLFLDVVFNLTYGTVHFKELPRELLFTDRVKRLVRNATGQRGRRALKWKKTLNAIDEGHV